MHFLCGYIYCKEAGSFLVDATTLPICLFSAKIYDCENATRVFFATFKFELSEFRVISGYLD